MTPFLIGPTGEPVLLGDLDLLTTSPTSRKAPAAASIGPSPVADPHAPPPVPQAAEPAEGSDSA